MERALSLQARSRSLGQELRDLFATDKNILVISAGPNGVVETLPTDSSAKGDGIVTVLGRRT